MFWGNTFGVCFISAVCLPSFSSRLDPAIHSKWLWNWTPEPTFWDGLVLQQRCLPM